MMSQHQRLTLLASQEDQSSVGPTYEHSGLIHKKARTLVHLILSMPMEAQWLRNPEALTVINIGVDSNRSCPIISSPNSSKLSIIIAQLV